MNSSATIAPGVIASAEYLGSPGSRVFAARTRPAKDPHGRLIVAPPFGAEAARNYRREVDLSRQLAGEGIETIRFHYRGSGQSDSVEHVDLESMLADAAAVRDAYRDDLPTTWMGTRLGAVVAAASSDSPLVMWDPVIDVPAYFREILRAAVFSAFKKDDPGTAPKSDLLRHLETTGMVDLLGYELNHRLYQQLCDAAPLTSLDLHGRSVALIDIRRRGNPRNETNRLAEKWRAQGANVTVEAVALNEPWWYGARAGSAADDGSDATRQLLDSTVDFVKRAVR